MKKIEFNEMEKYRAIVCLCILMTCATVTAGVACIPRERDALLALKNTSSVELNTWNWKGLNCCEWHGIRCSKYTSHVMQVRFSNENDVAYINKWFLYLRRGADLPRLSPLLFQLKHLEYLDLSNNYFQGALPRELFGLKKLRHLDLSYNFFEGEIPKDVGSLHSLTYLNLNSAGFQGRIPWQVGNLSQLQFLDLSDEAWPMKKSSLEWTENLRQLKYLRISWVLLNMASEELEASISPLHNLHHLDLSSCLVSGRIPNSIKNLTFLSVLELGGNDFTSIIPSWLENMTSLVSLGLNYNFLRGPFPLGLSFLPRLENLGLTLNQLSGDISQILCSQWPRLTSFSLSKSSVTGSMLPCIGNLSALQTLDLGYNLLTGEIPPSLAQLSSMRHLDLSNNHLNGIIPIFNGLLLPLERLDLSSNNLEGNFSLDVFQSSNNLNYLDLSYNKFIVRVKPEWIPSFNLRTLNLASCNIEGVIPLFLSTQYSLSNLDLSMNTLVGSIPPWLFGDFRDLHYLNLSHNSLQGQLPFTLNISSFSRLDLHNNLLNGYLRLPSTSSKNLELLDLSQNKFEGVIPEQIGRFIPFITFLSISENKLITGGIPSSIGSLGWLEVLDLSKNKLSGEIPSSLTNCTSLTRLNLEKNNLTGEIPAQIGILKYLKTLHLNGNRLKGRLPSSLQNCSSLEIVDLGNNLLTGNIPIWLAQLSKLMILVLRSNHFQGSIPQKLCNLSNLHVLDISHNNLRGAIPQQLATLKAMMDPQVKMPNASGDLYYYKEEILVSGKEAERVYTSSILLLITCIDISVNQLSGEIPSEFGNLRGLHTLNLSCNSLSGEIPITFGTMEQIESLDLSNNTLHGRIPSEMLNVSYLSHFIVSNNMLCGGIPKGRQFSTFNSTYFSGNPGLCGFPVNNRSCKCGEKSNIDTNSTQKDDNEEGEEGIPWHWYVEWMSSVAAGFWGVFGILIVKRQWRRRYIQILDKRAYNLVNRIRGG